MVLSNSGVNKEIKAEIKNYLVSNKHENINYQILWDILKMKNGIKKEVHSNTGHISQ